MIDRWVPMRLLTSYTTTNNDVMGWLSWLKWVFANADWAYGAAHANGGLQRQAWAETQNTIEVWRGDVRFRSEHPTLHFSARQDLNPGDAYTALEYYGSDGQWHAIETDTNAGLRFFGGSEERTYNASSWGIPDHGVLEVRFMIYGTSGGWAQMYRAYMSGWAGLPAWPTLPTFSNTVHPVGDYNSLVSALEYLKECARKPNLGSEVFTADHTQDGDYEPLGRWCWRQGGCKRLYLWLAVEGLEPGEEVQVFLEPDTYHQDAPGASRLNGNLPVAVLTADTEGQSINIDLTVYGVVMGERYAVEVGVLRNIRIGSPAVTIGAVTLGDLGSVTRTYAPVAEYPYGSQPDAAVFNRLRNDINQMYPAADRESPLWPEHPLATWRSPDAMGPLDRFHWWNKRYRIRHRARFLEVRTQGGAKIVSADRKNETTISDSNGDPLTVDTESIPWLANAYGQDYTVESYGTNEVLVAYEEYE